MLGNDLNDPRYDSMTQAYRTHYAALRRHGATAFFTRFDGGKTVDEYFKRARQNWHLNFLPHLPHKKNVALDIGFGGGGMLCAASESFQELIGIDVHGQESFVGEELRSRSVNRVQLLKGDGYTIPLEDASVNFIYSWVTFIHLTMGQALDYLCAIPRILKLGGKAVIFYCPVDHGWIQSDETRVNIWRLKLSDMLMKELAHRLGLVVLDIVTSIRPTGALGHQHGIVMKKEW